VLTYLERVWRWGEGLLQQLPADVRVIVVALLALIVSYAALVIVLRRLAPWLTGRVVLPVLGYLAFGLGVLLLGVQALVTAPFRLAELRPPNALFLVGDGVAASAGATERAAGHAAWWILTRRPIRGRYLLAIIVVVALWWNEVACGWLGTSSCQPPLAAVADAIGELATGVWHRFTA
jgi:hypothetical protein